jgi:Putative beta-barrel porin-2, OmpL-like. bbp2
MLRKFLTIAAIAVAPFSLVFSQDSTKKATFSISGSLDAYYRYNFSNAKDSLRTNNKTSFTNSQNSFELGMASVKLDGSIGKVGATVDLGFGTRATEFSYNESGSLAMVKQAFVTFAPSGKIKFTLGKWGTHIGYEVLDAYLNRNYSMDYMFSYGPFSHTGLKADIALSSTFGLMVGVANPTDYTSAPFGKKNFIAQLSGASKSGKVKGFLNYVGGKDRFGDNNINQVDLVITGTITDKFSIGYNGTVKSVKPTSGSANSWWGSALYLNVDPSSVFGLTLRGEYFGDKKGVAGLGTSLFDATLSANFRIDNLTIIPEFRLDSAKDLLFYKNSDTEDPSSKSTGSFILAATYHF